MGSCLSTHTHSPADGGPTSVSSSRSNRWKEKKKKKRGEGGLFDGRVVTGAIGGESELHRIPGRMFVNGSSDVACIFTQQGKKGTNQDAMIVWESSGSAPVSDHSTSASMLALYLLKSGDPISSNLFIWVSDINNVITSELCVNSPKSESMILSYNWLSVIV